MLRRVLIAIYLLVFVSLTGSVCTLPPSLQNGRFDDVSRGLVLTFTTSSFTGYTVRAKGTALYSYDCISNTDNIYVFKSTFSYSDRGNDRWIYLCMRITQVSNNLFYYYLMADLDTSGIVVPALRIYNPPANGIPLDTAPTCDFCQYNSPPPDSEYNQLRREGTSETLAVTPTLCKPCSTTENVCFPATQITVPVSTVTAASISTLGVPTLATQTVSEVSVLDGKSTNVSISFWEFVVQFLVVVFCIQIWSGIFSSQRL